MSFQHRRQRSCILRPRCEARLAGRCTDPVLAHFDLAFADLIKYDADLHGFGFPIRKIDSRIRKMERLAAATADLYQELEVLAELEQGLRRLQRNSPGLLVCRRRVAEQRQHVKCLRDASQWAIGGAEITPVVAVGIAGRGGKAHRQGRGVIEAVAEVEVDAEPAIGGKLQRTAIGMKGLFLPC